MNEVQNYLSKISQRYKTGISREHSYRGDLQSLLETLWPGVLVTNEPAHIACGAPDYILTKAHIPLGYIEAKLPRFSKRRLKMPNQISTWFSHEQCLGV